MTFFSSLWNVGQIPLEGHRHTHMYSLTPTLICDPCMHICTIDVVTYDPHNTYTYTHPQVDITNCQS